MSAQASQAIPRRRTARSQGALKETEPRAWRAFIRAPSAPPHSLRGSAPAVPSPRNSPGGKQGQPHSGEAARADETQGGREGGGSLHQEPFSGEDAPHRPMAPETTIKRAGRASRLPEMDHGKGEEWQPLQKEHRLPRTGDTDHPGSRMGTYGQHHEHQPRRHTPTRQEQRTGSGQPQETEIENRELETRNQADRPAPRHGQRLLSAHLAPAKALLRLGQPGHGPPTRSRIPRRRERLPPWRGAEQRNGPVHPAEPRRSTGIPVPSGAQSPTSSTVPASGPRVDHQGVAGQFSGFPFHHPPASPRESHAEEPSAWEQPDTRPRWRRRRRWRP